MTMDAGGVAGWSVQQVGQWLADLGLPAELAVSFAKNAVDGGERIHELSRAPSAHASRGHKRAPPPPPPANTAPLRPWAMAQSSVLSTFFALLQMTWRS